MEFRSLSSDNGGSGGHDHGEEWAETLARTVAHLAAQLTVAQIRLRALATELGERGGVDADAVAARVRAVAEAEGGATLRENLGPALVEVIDIETLERELVAYLSDPA
jgi:hypothetical protein